MFFPVCWCDFIIDLDSVWVEMKIVLYDPFQRCTRETKILKTSLGGRFRTPSDRNSHCMYIVSASSCTIWHFLPFCLGCLLSLWLETCVPTVNLAFHGKLLKLNCLQILPCTALNYCVPKKL